MGDIETAEVNPTAASKRCERADECIEALGSISSAFSSCIRKLRSNSADAGRDQYDELSLYEVERFLKAPSIKIPLYFLSQQRFTLELKERPFITPRDLMSLYTPHEMASAIALIYLYKRCTKRMGLSEEWEKLSKFIQEEIEIGIMLHNAIPNIPFADAMLVGGIRPLALSLINMKDPQGLKKYRRDLKIKNTGQDIAEELTTWGVSHMEISLRLITRLGFGKELAETFYRSLTEESDRALDDDSLRMRLLGFWITALHCGASPPSIRGEEAYLTSEAMLDQLFDSVLEIRNNGISQSWIGKSRADITAESTPQLFKETRNGVLSSSEQTQDGEVVSESEDL